MIENNIFLAIADIEKKVFSDSWTVESIKQAASMDYNKIFVAVEDKEGLSVGITDLNGGIHVEGNNIVSCGKQELKPVAYLIASIIGDETEILRIAVDENFRGRGIGDILMDKYLSYVTNCCERAFLEVRDGNLVARKLYEKKGYSKIAVRKNYYSNPSEDAAIYQLML